MGEVFAVLGTSGALELAVLGVGVFYAASRIIRTDWGSDGANLLRTWMAWILLFFGVVFFIGASIRVFQTEPNGQQPQIEQQQIEPPPA